MEYNFYDCALREGMFFQEECGISCSLPGSAVTIRFVGTEISVRIKDISGTGKSWVNAYIDDLPPRVFRIDSDSETETYQIADDLPNGEHTLMLQKRTEAVFGSILLKTFTLYDGKVLPPPIERPHKLLVMGDSITCGFGNEAQIPCDVDPSRENFALSYGYLTARMLNADILACAVSGSGIFQNYAGGKDGRMSDFFMGNFCTDLDNRALDKFVPDAAVINLGTNDWSAPIREEDYTSRYCEMLDFFRLRYPTLPLICAIGPMNLSPSPALSAMVKRRQDAGDANIYFLEFPPICRPQDGFGGSGHPSVVKHKEMADILTQTLRKISPHLNNSYL